MNYSYLLGFILLWYMTTSIGQNIQKINSCTCETSDGNVYSLMPFRRTEDNKPRFKVFSKKYSDWRYAYNPCAPIEIGKGENPKAKKICQDVGICKYAETEKPHEYHEVGIQTGVDCDTNQEGQIELVYKTNDPSIDTPHSRVVFICDESASIPDFEPKDEDNYIFTIRTRCACANRCWPIPTTPTPSDIPGPTKGTAPPTTTPPPTPTTTPPPTPTTTPPPTPTPTRNQTVPGNQQQYPEEFNWKLLILLPSLAGFFAILLCFLCLWWQLDAVKEALRLRCCRCCDGHNEPGVEGERMEHATETTALIKNQQNNQAVEHEDPGERGKLKEPVQEEEVADDYGKHNKTVAV